MTTKLFFKMLAFAGILAGASVNAHGANEAFMKLSTNVPATEEFSLTGAEVLIEGNAVSIVYATQPAKNRTFEFDRITSFEFGLRTTSSIDSDKGACYIAFRAYMDDAGMLHIEAAQPLLQVNVYTTTGALVASQKTSDKQMQINLYSAPRGVYIVQSGINRQLIIK